MYINFNIYIYIYIHINIYIYDMMTPGIYYNLYFLSSLPQLGPHRWSSGCGKIAVAAL